MIPGPYVDDGFTKCHREGDCTEQTSIKHSCPPVLGSIRITSDVNLGIATYVNGNLVDCCNSATGARCRPEGGPDWTPAAYFFQSGPSPSPINTICKSYAR